jgi:hypothetical protein
MGGENCCREREKKRKKVAPFVSVTIPTVKVPWPEINFWKSKPQDLNLDED